MQLKGFINLRDSFEDTLHEIVKADVFVSEAAYTACIKHESHKVEDTRVYDLLFMMNVFASRDPRFRQPGVPIPFVVHVDLNDAGTKLMAFQHPLVMAFCVAVPNEDKLWGRNEKTG
jgi:hypothetical protein